jgi:outer membrane lipoprotein carrier protein
MLKYLFVSLILLGSLAFAKPSKDFDTTIKKYQKAKLVSMDVEKTVVSELLGKETKYKGQILLSSGKFRWENETPEKTVLLFDGQTLLNVQYPSKDFGGPVQIAKSKIDKKTKKQILISSLLSPSTTKSNFKVLEEKKEGPLTDVKLAPSGEDLQIKDLMIQIDPKNKRINEISYKDDLGNITKMVFSNVKFQSKADPEIFKFKAPKGAQVTNL